MKYDWGTTHHHKIQLIKTCWTSKIFIFVFMLIKINFSQMEFSNLCQNKVYIIKKSQKNKMGVTVFVCIVKKSVISWKF